MRRVKNDFLDPEKAFLHSKIQNLGFILNPVAKVWVFMPFYYFTLCLQATWRVGYPSSRPTSSIRGQTFGTRVTNSVIRAGQTVFFTEGNTCSWLSTGVTGSSKWAITNRSLDSLRQALKLWRAGTTLHLFKKAEVTLIKMATLQIFYTFLCPFTYCLIGLGTVLSSSFHFSIILAPKLLLAAPNWMFYGL